MVLMDSNRRNINFSNLFLDENVQVVPCGSVKYALEKVIPKLKVVPDVVIIHLGTNDLKSSSPQQYSILLLELVQLLRLLGCEVYVSEILPRNDQHEWKVESSNSNIRRMISTPYRIDHPVITKDHLYDDVHLGAATVNNEKYSGSQLLGRDIYHKLYGRSPLDSRIPANMPGDFVKKKYFNSQRAPER